MNIEHHPCDHHLSRYAAGELDEGQSLAIATHLEGCRLCRTTVMALEQVGGAALDEVAPVAMSPGALARVHAQITQSAFPPARSSPPKVDPLLPRSVAKYALSRWKWVAPGVSMRPIVLPAASRTRAFLLRSAKGTSMLQHSHSGIEMTCVLSGSFSHAGGRFAAGDFDFGNDDVDHRPVVGSDEDCVCLVAMTGELRLKGLLGKMIQPFIRL